MNREIEDRNGDWGAIGKTWGPFQTRRSGRAGANAREDGRLDQATTKKAAAVAGSLMVRLLTVG